MRLSYLNFTFIFCFFLISSSMAQASNAGMALKEAKQGNWSQAKVMAAQSNNATAKNLLNWYYFNDEDNNYSFKEVADFILQHPDWPYLAKIQRNAEAKLSRSGSNAAIQFLNQKPPLTGAGMIAYLNALSSAGQSSKISSVLNNWWAGANLDRDEQRDIFSTYGRYINRESNVKRLNKLLAARAYSNAIGIASVLGGGYPALVTARQALAQQKGNVNPVIDAVPGNLQNDEGLLYDRLVWRRKNKLNTGAIEILNAAPSAAQMHSPKAWWRERHIIVRRLIEQKQYPSAYRLAAGHKQKDGFPLLQAEWVSGWLALEFANKPWEAFEHFEKLYKAAETPISKARGAYWAGKASEKLGHPDTAAQWYRVAASHPEVFYGQIAANKAGLARTVLFTNSGAGTISGEGAKLIQAARWLSEAGLKNESSAFLLRASSLANNVNEYKAVAAAAESLDQRNIAIKVAASLQKEKSVSLYDVLYPNVAKDLNNVRNVEWAFAHAIMRQESRFDSNAVSHAGARGLMQLMPGTARDVASRKGIRHQKSWLTSRPAHNITLGSGYLSQMLDRYDGNYAMAAAAYNAGPGRVDRWITEFGDPRSSQVDFINWVESIPIYETRNYVQRVLEAVDVYRDRLKGQQPTVLVAIHVPAK